MEEIKVSVIIPFFGVAAFVERCSKSLMMQTLKEVEFIFVDDASQDESRTIIERVCAQFDRDVKILTHSVNKGLPAARNTGLEVAKGEFIYHCDSDDFLEPTMLEEMYEAATSTSSDMAYCDFYIDFGTSRRVMTTPDYPNAEIMVKEGFLAGMMKYNVWNKLVRRNLYERPHPIRFPEGHSMGEDMTMIALGMCADGVVRVSRPLYHYMKTNDCAFTNTFSERHLSEIAFNTNHVIGLLEGWNTVDKDLFIALFKLNVKLPFLFSGSYSQYRLWQCWYPEANAFIGRNLILPRRTILVQQFARLHLYPLVWLYAFSVNRVYYGLILRGK